MTASHTGPLPRPAMASALASQTASTTAAGPESKFSQWVDTDEIHWHIQRAGSGIPMLLVHGTGSSTHSWSGLLPQLSEDHELLAPDLPGLGQTRAPDADFSIGGMAQSVGQLLRHTRFEPRVAVGHSAGVAIILRMVLDGWLQPNLVVGINAALLPFGGTLARALQPLARLFSRLPVIPTLAAARARQPGAVERLIGSTGSRLSPEGIADYRRLLGSERHVAATLSMMASWDLDGLLADLPRLDVPLCLIVGGRDYAVPPGQAERIRSRMRHVSVRRLPGLGHLAHEERPQLMAEIIRECERQHEDAS